MGGGVEGEWVETEDLEGLAAHIFCLCDSVAYGVPPCKERAELDKEYAELDAVLASLGDSLPFVVGKSAAHVIAVQRLRQLAMRYKELEVSTSGYLECARRLVGGFISLLDESSRSEGQPALSLVNALRQKSISLFQAVNLAAQHMQGAGEMLEATAAAHLAVSRDMDLLVLGASDVLEDPTKCDIGVKAAPVIGATAGGSLGLLLLRGVLGPVGALALGALGAIGAQEITQNNVVPHVKVAFQRMYNETSQLSSLIESKASALSVVAKELMASSVQLQQLLAFTSRPGPVSAVQLAGQASELHASLSTLSLRCESCKQRLTAFRALSYSLSPEGSSKTWFRWRQQQEAVSPGKQL